MEFLPEVQNVLRFLHEYSQGKLRKPQDLGGLLDIAARRNLADVMNTLIFVGSALWKVHRALQRAEKRRASVSQLEQELYGLARQMRQQLELILDSSDAPVAFVQRCRKIYFEAPGALRNLLDLAYDLFWLHQLQNEMRRRRTNEG